MSTSGNVVVFTGASSGFGAFAARAPADGGHTVTRTGLADLLTVES